MHHRNEDLLDRESLDLEGRRAPEEIGTRSARFAADPARQGGGLGGFGVEERFDGDAGAFRERRQHRSRDLLVDRDVGDDRPWRPVVTAGERDRHDAGGHDRE